MMLEVKVYKIGSYCHKPCVRQRPVLLITPQTEFTVFLQLVMNSVTLSQLSRNHAPLNL